MADGTWQECEKQNQKGQWIIPPTVEQFPGQVTTDLRTGRVGLHKDDGFLLSRPPPKAWLNRPEGPQVAKIRKAFGFDEGR
jgi:hypothetical protein